MYKMTFRSLASIVVLTILAGCSTAPATQAPVVVEVTQPLPEPTVTMVPPTEPPVEASPTASLSTPTPVITEIVATSIDQFAGSWKWFIQGTPTTFTFNPDGTWVVIRADAAPGTVSADGEYSFDGTLLTITGDPDCPGVVGKYEAPRIVQYDGANYKLTIKAMEDECEGRAKDFKRGLVWSDAQAE